MVSFACNEQTVLTQPDDKGAAVLDLNKKGHTYEELSKKVGVNVRSLTSYANLVEAQEEVIETMPEVKTVIEEASQRRRKTLSRISNLPPYRDDPIKQIELYRDSEGMTLDALDALEKDLRLKMPIDTKARQSTRSNYQSLPLHVPNELYALLADRCIAEDTDITKIIMAFLDQWANYKIDIEY